MTKTRNMTISLKGIDILCEINPDMDVFTDEPIDENSKFIEWDEYEPEETNERGFYATPLSDLFRKYGKITFTSLNEIEIN
jgi:hypothetical protein